MASNIQEALSRAQKMIANDAKADSAYLKAREMNRRDPKFHKGEPNDMYTNVDTLTSMAGGSQQSYSNVNESYETEDMENFNAAYDNMTEQLLESVKGNKSESVIQESMVQSNGSFNKSRLPKEILKSFSDNYIDESLTDFRRDLTLESAQQALINKTAPKKVQRVNEQTVVVPQASSIDYSLIKTIVEDCMKKYSSAIVKKVLNESIGNGEDSLKAIKVGDKFSFITSSGDLYEAELKFKKNINKKK